MNSLDIYVLNSNGKLLYNHKNDSRKNKIADLINVLKALEQFAEEFGEHIIAAQMGKNYFYQTTDQLTDIYIVVKSKKKLGEKTVQKLLLSIKNIFMNLFTHFYNLKEEEKEKKWKIFQEKVEDQLKRIIVDSTIDNKIIFS
ncbi:MAG: hypothetical protein ACOC44_11325 [Promethearchaeia archaeon]